MLERTVVVPKSGAVTENVVLENAPTTATAAK
jgi:hypothetical protein